MCRAISRFFAVGFALLMTALGLTVMSLGLYTLAKFDDLSYLGFSRNAVYTLIGVGTGLAITSLAGACAAKKHIRFLLIAYLVVILALIIVEVIAGVVIYKYDNADYTMENVDCLYLTCCKHNMPKPTDGKCAHNRWAGDSIKQIDALCGKLSDATAVDVDPQGPPCQTPKAFDDALRSWLDSELNTLSLVAAVTGGIEFLGAIAVCALLRMGGGDDEGGATDEMGYTSLELSAEQQARRARVEERKQFYRDKYKVGRGPQPGIDNAHDHTPAFAQYLDRKAQQDADAGNHALNVGSPGRVTGAAAREVVARGSFSSRAKLEHEEVNPMYSSQGANFLNVI